MMEEKDVGDVILNSNGPYERRKTRQLFLSTTIVCLRLEVV